MTSEDTNFNKLLNDLSKINPKTKAFIDESLEKEIPLANIANMTGFSEPWLQDYAKLRTILPPPPPYNTIWILAAVVAVVVVCFVAGYVVHNIIGCGQSPEVDCSVDGKNLFRDPLQDGGCGPVMVKIPAGHFQMGDIEGSGDKDERPIHLISVASFAMCRSEVTFAEYDQFAEATARDKPYDNGYGRGNRPVINVSWDDARAYLAWLSKQTNKDYGLPSEAQWEYAARAGTTTKYWWGDVASHDNANYGTNNCCNGLIKGKDRWKYTSPAGSFEPNPFNLYDMIGNVWEWVADPYHNNYKNAPEDGSVWGDKNAEEMGDNWVLRGCSWYNNPRICRVSNRHSDDEQSNHIGFRCYRSIED